MVSAQRVPTPAEFTDYGPDFSATPTEAPKTTPLPRATKDAFSSLGANKKTRSGIRKLSEEDKPKLATWYTGIRYIAGFVRPALAAAMSDPNPELEPGEPGDAINTCVDAWFDLAEDNDKVRRLILAMVEGGGWGKVFFAHLPFLIAVLPTAFVEQFLTAKLGAMLGGQDVDFSALFPGVMYPADMQEDPNA